MELSEKRYAPADFGLGLVLATVAKEFDEAETIVRSGLEIAPTDVTGHFVLAWVLYSTARLEEAEQSAREAIRSAPAYAGPRLLLAQIHLRENKLSTAVEDLDEYLALGIASSMDGQVRAVRAQALRALEGANGGAETAEAGR
jgi:tetratricopeptide (TPR) repeat protein